MLFTDLILHQVLDLLEKIDLVHGIKLLTVVGQFVGAILLFEGVVLQHCLSLFRPRHNRTACLFLEVDCSILKDHLTLPCKSQVELLPPCSDHVELRLELGLRGLNHCSIFRILAFRFGLQPLLCGNHQLVSVAFWENDCVSLLLILERCVVNFGDFFQVDWLFFRVWCMCAQRLFGEDELRFFIRFPELAASFGDRFQLLIVLDGSDIQPEVELALRTI